MYVAKILHVTRPDFSIIYRDTTYYSARMKKRMAYKFKLKLSAKQKSSIANYVGSTRFLWNKALALNLSRLKEKQHILYYQELDFFSKLWKKSDEYGFLKECPSQAIQQKLKDLEKAFKD